VARQVAAVLFVLFVYFAGVSQAFEVLDRSGFYGRVYGPDLAPLCKEPDRKGRAPAWGRLRDGLGAAGGPGAASGATADAVRRAGRTRLLLWARALAFPFQALAIPFVLLAFLGARPAQLGLTRRRLGRNVLFGLVGWVVFTPLAFGVNVLTARFLSEAGLGGEQEHPLTQLAGLGPTPAEWALLIFTAVVVAPVLEELIFRGVLQPWFAGLRAGGHVAVGAALALAVWERADALHTARGGRELAEAAAPALFVLALVPFYLLIWWRGRRAGRLAGSPLPSEKAGHADAAAPEGDFTPGPAPAGAVMPPAPAAPDVRARVPPPVVFATALLFGALHSFAWPTPVALFVLGLGLGALAARSGSLVGPIVLHALFNAVSCVLLLSRG
jgi:membrane protease YdiL (CAAX protease family)